LGNSGYKANSTGKQICSFRQVNSPVTMS